MQRFSAEQLMSWGARPVRGDTGVDYSGVTADSRRVSDGALFIAIVGNAVDGLVHVEDALRRGAAGVLVDQGREELVSSSMATVYVADDPRSVLAAAVRHVHDYPDRQLKMIAVTGTNGKTTVAHLLRDMLQARGGRFGLLGTIRYDTGRGDYPAPLTTPGVEDFFALLAEMVRGELDGCVFEASSHALDQQRLGESEVDLAVFLNLEPEHLDYHGDLESYRDAKARLLNNLAGSDRRKKLGHAIVNADVASFAELAGPAENLRFGTGSSASHRRRGARCDAKGVSFQLDYAGDQATLHAPLLGGYNVENLHAAAATLSADGVTLLSIVELAKAVQPVPGRMEPLRLPGGPLCVLDYAHTADGIDAALSACRDLASGRVAIVFGCGGDRDRGKRPEMARIAVEAADLAVLTLDNPRTEDPEQIFADAKKGFQNSKTPERGVVVEDRADALRYALKWARNDDLVLVTGKGHERYQIIGEERLPWDDGAVLLKAWNAMEAGA